MRLILAILGFFLVGAPATAGPFIEGVYLRPPNPRVEPPSRGGEPAQIELRRLRPGVWGMRATNFFYGPRRASPSDCAFVAQVTREGDALAGPIVPFETSSQSIDAEDLRETPGDVRLRLTHTGLFAEQMNYPCGIGVYLGGRYHRALRSPLAPHALEREMWLGSRSLTKAPEAGGGVYLRLSGNRNSPAASSSVPLAQIELRSRGAGDWIMRMTNLKAGRRGAIAPGDCAFEAQLTRKGGVLAGPVIPFETVSQAATWDDLKGRPGDVRLRFVRGGLVAERMAYPCAVGAGLAGRYRLAAKSPLPPRALEPTPWPQSEQRRLQRKL